MSLAELKDQIATLPLHQQRELMAFMVSIQTEKDHAFRRELARKIDDRDPSHWSELDDLSKKLAD